MTAPADVSARRASVTAAQQAVQAAEAARQAANAQVAALQAQLRDAGNQVGYVTVRVASAGRVGKRTVEVGQRVQPGQQLAAIVEPEV